MAVVDFEPLEGEGRNAFLYVKKVDCGRGQLVFVNRVSLHPDPKQEGLFCQAGEYTEPLVIVSRKEWGALPPKATVPMEHPVKKVVHTHTTRMDTCETRVECIKVMQEMQKEHMDKGLSDIAYNFLVGRDGTVYEGRGWHFKSSKSLKKNPKLYNTRLDIGFIGDYSTDMIPPIDMVEGAVNLCIYGMEQNYIEEPYKLVKIRNWRERQRQAKDMPLPEPPPKPKPASPPQ